MRSARLWVILLASVVLAAAVMAVPVRVLVTGDMHGQVKPSKADGKWLGGAAEMLGYWKAVEGYQPGRFLTISCGDNVTGPALATVFKGDSVIPVMNLMGYDVSAVGNHDFDFGADQLRHWGTTARFPFIAANLTNADGSSTDLAQPYYLNTEQGVKVAVIGLTTKDLETATGGADACTVIPYAEALRKAVPEARARGAEVVIVAAHAPMDEVKALAEEVGDLNIPLMLGGHSHEYGQYYVNNATLVVNSGLWWYTYSRIDLDYNPATKRAVALTAKQVALMQDTTKPDKAIAAEIATWQAKMDAEYSREIGYTAAKLDVYPALQNFITDCWMAYDPTADLALNNDGAVRQPMQAGPINRAIIISVLPFNDALYRINLTGAQLLAYLPKGDGIIGMSGIVKQGEVVTLVKTGKPIDPAAIYRVVLNDYMYNTNDALKAADPQPVVVTDDWRTPLYDWFATHATSKTNPVNTLIDATPRITP